MGMEPTPLGGPKLGAILKPGISPTAFLIYGCGAAHAQAVGRRAITHIEYGHQQESHPEHSTALGSRGTPTGCPQRSAGSKQVNVRYVALSTMAYKTGRNPAGDTAH